MKTFLLLTITIWTYIYTVVRAQEAAFTIEQATRYALKHSEILDNLKIDQKIAEAKIAEQKSRLYYPQISGQLDLRDNLILQTSVLPGTLRGLPEEQRINVQFGTQYNATLALEANLTIFDASLRAGIEQAKAGTIIAEKNWQKSRIDAVLAVKSAYYAALLAKERIKAAESALNRNKQLLADAQTLKQNELTQPVDVDRAQFNVANQNAELDRAQRLYRQSLLTLKYRMGMPVNDTLLLADSLLFQRLSTPDTDSADITPSALNVSKRIEYQLYKIQLEQDKLGLVKNQKAYWPTVAIYGYIATQALRKKFDYFDVSKRWFPFSYIGLRLNVPIFDGFQKRALVQQSQLQIQKRENEIKAFEKQAAYEIANTHATRLNTRQAIIIRKNNIQIAEKLLQTTRIRYQLGLQPLKDVTDAENQLIEAQTNYIAALYDYVVAELEAEKAAGIVTAE